MVNCRNRDIRFLLEILHRSNLRLYLEPRHIPASNTSNEFLMVHQNDKVGLRVVFTELTCEIEHNVIKLPCEKSLVDEIRIGTLVPGSVIVKLELRSRHTSREKLDASYF